LGWLGNTAQPADDFLTNGGIMPTIRFTATPELPFDIAHLGYKAGDVLEMNDASARRWVRRGVAVYVVEAAVPLPDGRRIPIEFRASEAAASELVSPDLPVALDPVLMPEPANEIGNSDEKPAEAVANVEENGEGEPASEPAIDESPRRRGRPRR
jgi:hypothetical protein